MHFEFDSFSIPVELMKKTGCTQGNFGLGRTAVQRLQAIGLQPHHAVLEIGSGIGRCAMALAHVLATGSYVGIDLVHPAVTWCQTNITTRYPNFSFIHYDVLDALHNPNGKLSAPEVHIEFPSNSVDRVLIWATLTHMLPQTVEHYFREVRRVLKSDGLALVSCHLLTKEIQQELKDYGAPNGFDYEYELGCYVRTLDCPTLEVAYLDERMNELLDAAGLAAQEVEYGRMRHNNRFAPFQDIMTLRSK
ncbi:class I SAM-dependent methyltransferase [Bradyrhizobium sp. 62B]|uniref:class I SAM-dependent methyltransferase n=1 Tax=Bradyrhizobium sp. 62B TaxID=2898442 RepID=UPI002557FE8B|nr:class I SAM-dependent methyltransferase [Bradyrhizobium sp. 62B]